MISRYPNQALLDSDHRSRADEGKLRDFVNKLITVFKYFLEISWVFKVWWVEKEKIEGIERVDSNKQEIQK